MKWFILRYSKKEEIEKIKKSSLPIKFSIIIIFSTSWELITYNIIVLVINIQLNQFLVQTFHYNLRQINYKTKRPKKIMKVCYRFSSVKSLYITEFLFQYLNLYKIISEI